MIDLDGISHCALRTADVERSVQFYLNAVGIDLTERNEDGTAYLRLGPMHHCLALYPLEYEIPYDRETTGRLGLDHVAFAVSDRSAVDEAARTLEQAGARILFGPETLNEPGGPYAVRFADFDGNRIEICAEMENWAEPGIAQPAKPLRLGHVNLHVRDPKESLTFYTEILGFQALDWIEDFFVFLKCPGNLDHHNSALVKGPDVAPSMNHAGFEVRDVEALKTVCDVMWKNGVKILWGPSRHGPGHNLFIYFPDPDGNVVEVFAEIDKIPDVARYRRRVWSIPEAASVWTHDPAPEDFVEATETVGLIANQGAAGKTKA